MSDTIITRFEVRAEAFRIMTGYMAPGKDESMCVGTPYEERRAAFEAWLVQYGEVIDAFDVAIQRMLGDQP